MTLDYFTLEEFRTLPDMASEQRYPDVRVTGAAEYVQSVIERTCGTSFVGREVTETLDGLGSTGLVLRTPYVLSVTSATVNGIEVENLSAVGGVLEHRGADAAYPSAWSRGRRNVEVTYVAGYSEEPPADIREAAMQATRARLLDSMSNSKVNDRRSSVSDPEGGTTTYVVAGLNQPTGYPEVDAVILGWARKLNTVVFP